MQKRYGVAARRGRAAVLVVVLAVGVALGVTLWWVGRSPSQGDEARGAATATGDAAPDASELRGGDANSLAGGAAAAAGDEGAEVPAAAVAPSPVAYGWTKERVNETLDTFWGREPDIDRLLAMIRVLGEKAEIVEDSIHPDTEPEFGTIYGRVEIPELGMSGGFAMQGNRMDVNLVTETEIAGVEERSFGISMRTGATGIEAGTAYIHHSVYEHEEPRQHQLAVERHPTGWEVRTNRAHGTTARPIFMPDPRAYEYDDKGPIPIPTQYTGDPVEQIRDPIRIDFGPWQVWREKIEPHKP